MGLLYRPSSKLTSAGRSRDSEQDGIILIGQQDGVILFGRGVSGVAEIAEILHAIGQARRGLTAEGRGGQCGVRPVRPLCHRGLTVLARPLLSVMSLNEPRLKTALCMLARGEWWWTSASTGSPH